MIPVFFSYDTFPNIYYSRIKMKPIESKTETNTFGELVRKLQEKRGIHLCHVKNGTIQESPGRHTIGEIESAGGMNIISIARGNL